MKAYAVQATPEEWELILNTRDRLWEERIEKLKNDKDNNKDIYSSKISQVLSKVRNKQALNLVSCWKNK